MHACGGSCPLPQLDWPRPPDATVWSIKFSFVFRMIAPPSDSHFFSGVFSWASSSLDDPIQLFLDALQARFDKSQTGVDDKESVAYVVAQLEA